MAQTDMNSQPADAPPMQERLPAQLKEQFLDGSLAIVMGLMLLAGALRTRRRQRSEAMVQAIAGAGLLGYGLRRQMQGDATDEMTTDRPEHETDDSFEVGDDFEGITADPRQDDPTEIEISEADIAAEPGEAAGPDPTHAEPTRMEETEPETDVTPEEAEDNESMNHEDENEKDEREETGEDLHDTTGDADDGA